MTSYEARMRTGRPARRLSLHALDDKSIRLLIGRITPWSYSLVGRSGQLEAACFHFGRVPSAPYAITCGNYTKLLHLFFRPAWTFGQSLNSWATVQYR